MANNKNESKIDAALPLLATAALNGAGVDNEQMNALVSELLQDQLTARRKENARRERLAKSAIQSVKEAEESRDAQQKHCSHRKQDDSTRLSGQYLSGTGQLALVCGFCSKNFHLPPLDGQEAPPRNLIPSADMIGG